MTYLHTLEPEQITELLADYNPSEAEPKNFAYNLCKTFAKEETK